MGACESNNCSSTIHRRQTYNSKIDYQRAKTEIHEKDESLKEILVHLEEIEALRKKFSVKWNNFLCESGAVVLHNPTIKSCLVCYTYRFSHDLTEKNIESIKFELTPPWFNFEEEYLITKKVKQFVKDIDEFLKFAADIQIETEDLYSKFIGKYETAKDKLDQYHNEGENKEEDSKHVLNTKEILQAGHETIAFINNVISKRETEIKNFQDELKDEEFRKELINICTESNKKKIEDDPLVFSWNYTKEKRLHNLTDARFRKTEMRKNKEEIENEKMTQIN